MLDVFSSVKKLLKLETVSIDNNVFRLHYKATVIILIAFSLLVTSRQYVGDPIHCIVDSIPHAVMNTYCWITTTYLIPKWLNGTNGDVLAPGVGPYNMEKDEVRYYKYYQWVCFALFFQAIWFYVPRYLWKAWEGGRIKMLVHDLDRPMIDTDYKTDRMKVIVNYFHANLNTHNFYAIRFFICEILNFINVVVQIIFMDCFLGGEFSTYGINVVRLMHMEPQDRVDPMARVFPKLTKCIFDKYGVSGTVEKLDGLCLLPLNVVNEKVYVFLWFWFMFLAVVTGAALVFRAVVVAFPHARVKLLQARCRAAPPAKIEAVARRLPLGDWFVLHQLGKNVNPLVFSELMCELADTVYGSPLPHKQILM